MKYPKRCQYKHAKQKKYHVRNWAEYNEGLRRRGDLTVWFDEEAIANWKAEVLALFTVGDVYASLCKKSVYAPFIAQRRSRALFGL